MKISFEELKKECKTCAIEFLEELEMLPIFLNYFPSVQEKWLEEAGISKSNIAKIKAVISEYAKEKVALENKRLPKTREDVIKIEDEVLKKMFVAKLFKTNLSPAKDAKVIENIIKQEYPEAAIVTPEQLRKIEKFVLFKKLGKKFPMDWLVFDPKGMKIISIEVVKK